MPIILASNWQLSFLKSAEEGKINERRTRGSIFGLFAYKVDVRATNRATAPGDWIPKMLGLEGAIDGTHTCSDILLKNDQINIKDDFILVKDNLKFIFNQI